MKQYILLNYNQVINILKRYYSKFTYKLTANRVKDQFKFNVNNIIYINSYIIKCVYVNEKLEKYEREKSHLVLKYCIDNDNYTSIISLNILLDDYIDLIS
jgi:hypothetical protein